jgi:hypothetical protein
MKLSPVALAVGAAFIWGAAIFVIGGINSFVPGYGEPVLELVVSLYPGYEANGEVGDLLLGTAYAIFDGLAAGFVFALLYNAVARLTGRRGQRGAPLAPAASGAQRPLDDGGGSASPPTP